VLVSEPTVELYHGRTLGNRLAAWFAATRPPFLTASVLPVLAAGALAYMLKDGDISRVLLALAVLNVALIHSGANVINDYYDALNGTDGCNTQRIYPFSGGSRFIQNSVLTLEETRNLGFGLLGAGAVLGLAMVSVTGSLLLVMGLTGGALAVIYSAPPCLACRGLGDIVVATSFGVLPVAGTTLILIGSIPAEAWWLGAALGCFVAAILWVNSVPDIAADREAGKMTLPARLGPCLALALLPVWFVAGYGLLLASGLPRTVVLLGLVGLVPAGLATRAANTGAVGTAMPLTIVTQALMCVLVGAGLLLS
jgi:1,4-dihydroxy-2-naphthoate octaprenyltransferase